MSIHIVETRCGMGSCGKLLGRTWIDDDLLDDDGWGVAALEVRFPCPVHGQVEVPSIEADRFRRSSRNQPQVVLAVRSDRDSNDPIPDKRRATIAPTTRPPRGE